MFFAKKRLLTKKFQFLFLTAFKYYLPNVMSKIPSIKLSNGMQMPVIGLGTYKVTIWFLLLAQYFQPSKASDESFFIFARRKGLTCYPLLLRRPLKQAIVTSIAPIAIIMRK
jgi:ABC-type dipeptide/oligopeptide/nickel transport system permease component